MLDTDSGSDKKSKMMQRITFEKNVLNDVKFIYQNRLS